MDWEFSDSCLEVIKKLKKDGANLYCIETGDDSEVVSQATFQYPAVLVFGSENYGVSQEVLDCCDKKIKIPMLGTGKSLNVSNSVSIAVYEALRKFI